MRIGDEVRADSQQRACAKDTKEEHYTGALVEGEWEQQPLGSYYQSAAGIHAGWLVGPVGSDFNLYLYKWSSSGSSSNHGSQFLIGF